MNRTVHVATAHPYDVLIGPGLLPRAGEELRRVCAPCRAAIITDTTVNALYGEAVEQSLQSAGFSTLRYAFPAGEKNKTWQTLGGILEFLAENRLTRADLVVALGGGVPGDVAGFAAAVYARGVRFVQLATTLLAAVDSSVGGKTAVDLKAGKNLAGAFHQPELVLTDTEVMAALPAELLRDGAAEIIKAGVIADESLFDAMTRPDWRRQLPKIIARSVEIKRDVVEGDEFDTGARQLLNLGHTFGHAIEKCSGFALTHGQGVAIGMVLAACAAGQKEAARAVCAANRCCGLPTMTAFSAEELAEAALSDKKRQGGSISLVLPERIGACRLEKIPVEALEGVFARALAAAKEING